MADPKPKRGAKKPAAKKPAAKPAPAKKGATAAAAKASAKKPAAKPAPDIPARIDGLRGWLDQIERRQGRMSYIGAAGILIALACAGVALYLGISANQDMAKQSDLDKVSDQISKVSTESQSQVDAKLKSVNDTLSSLQQQVAAAQQAAQQAKTQAAQAQAAPPASFTPATPTTPTSPGNGNGTGGSGN
jgi:hypothetical protein